MAFKAFVFLFLALLLFTTGSSTVAPAHPPEKPPTAVHPPVHPPVKAPIGAPPVKPYGCVAKCEELCKTHRKKRSCMTPCTACCKKTNECVPQGYTKCSGWDYVSIHGKKTACPY
ncbi:hypothetical protein ACJRO7_005110 [Eucalyptus globulus]|uniref:Uncharacterized protein n=1 Tax=Eucalyptus globulus TaxID=34317 RepID=A0ABD3IZ48_EUCGL